MVPPAAVLALFAGMIGTTWQARVASREGDRAAEQARVASAQRDRAVEAEIIAASARKRSDHITAFRREMLSSVKPDRQGRDVTVRQVLDKASARLEAGLEDEPEVEAALRSTIGNTYGQLGLFGPAVRHLSAARAVHERLHGAEHETVAEDLNDLAVVSNARGDYSAAEDSARRALAMWRKLAGSDHPDVAVSLGNLGFLLIRKGEPAAAEPMLREAVHIWQKGMPEGHWEIAYNEGVFGACLTALERYEEAEKLLVPGYAIVKAALGERHPAASGIVCDIVNLYESWEKLEQAAEWRTHLPHADSVAARPAAEEDQPSG